MEGTIHAAFTTPNIQALGNNWTFGLEIFTGFFSFLPYLPDPINWLRQGPWPAFVIALQSTMLAVKDVNHPHWLTNNLTIMGIQKTLLTSLTDFYKNNMTYRQPRRNNINF